MNCCQICESYDIDIIKCSECDNLLCYRYIDNIEYVNNVYICYNCLLFI